MEAQNDFGQSDPDLIKYSFDTFKPEDSDLEFARLNAQKRGLQSTPVNAFEARHLEVLVRLSGAKRGVEIGTRGGYSSIALARGLGAGGRLHTFELDHHDAEVARMSLSRARLLSDVIIHVGPALENLPSIANEAPFDLIFIDGDKVNYPEYLEWSTRHLRVGGAILADNTFASGKIHRLYDLGPEEERQVKALREFNSTLAHSGRYRCTILPTVDGLMVAIKIN